MGYESEEWQARDTEACEMRSLVQVRDMMVECIVATHGEYFGQSRAALGLDACNRAVRTSVQGIVRLAFKSVGGSYDTPTLDAVARVVDLLSERQLGWGASPDEVFEQHSLMMRHLGKIAITQNPGMDAAHPAQ